MIFSTLAIPIFLILAIIKGTYTECWGSEVLLQEPKTSEYLFGPDVIIPINGSRGNFTINFWVKFDITGVTTDTPFDFTVLYTAIPKPSNTAVKLFMDVFIRKTANTDWYLGMKNDKEEVLFDKDNLYNQRTLWWFISISNSETALDPVLPVPKQTIKIRFQDTIKSLVTGPTEAWSVTDGMEMRLFANKPLSDKFFHGTVAKVDWFFNDAYTTSASKYDNYEYGIPRPIYLIDFTEPEFTQYFNNRIPSGYDKSMRGKTNHSDIHDIWFNPVNYFGVRHWSQYIQLPTFAIRPHVRQNYIYNMKFRGWALNHWHQGGLYLTAFMQWSDVSSYRQGFEFRKIDYHSNLRLNIRYSEHRHICNYGVPSGSQAHKAYTEGYGFIAHVYGSGVITKRSLYSYGCNGYMSTGYRTVGNVGFGASDFFLIGQKYDQSQQSYIFPDRPFRQQDTDMQVELDYHLFLLLEDGYRSSPLTEFPSVCNANSLEEYGTGIDAFRGTCATGYSPYHEINQCFLDPVSNDYFDCKHDMDTAGSKCYRCPRYYGKVGTQGCNRCYANCLECSGPNSDECTYCGMGYGFTGTSCRKCDETEETWDLSKNLCQKKKIKFLEAQGGLETFGEIKLIYTPLHDQANGHNGEADLSLYVEGMFNRFWINDINFQYYLIREYKDLPLHRKVSISAEFMQIDCRHYRYFFLDVDDTYLYMWTPNHEDNTTGIIETFWNYDYYDQPPFKESFTIMHNANTMRFGLVGHFAHDWASVWIRELNVTFFGCYEACATCWEDNSPVHCLSCLPGYYLVGAECKACEPGCATCNIIASNCTSCPSGEFLKGTSCVLTCGLGFYADVSNTCQPCRSECVQCNAWDACNSCKNGFYLSVASCLACDTNCETCTSTATKCLTCKQSTANKWLRNFACVTSCGAGYFEVPGNVCNPCPPGCTTCSSTECLTCDSGYKKKNNICANPCGTGWYDGGVKCEKCDTKCATCSGSSSNCLTCAAGYAQTPSACPACTSPCTTCSTSSTTCTSCSGSLYLSGNTCVDSVSCPPKTYAKDNVCQPCHVSCDNCVNSATFCTSCPVGAKLYKNTCPLNCPAGYSPYLGITCCPDSCSSCTDTETCTACNNGFFLSGVKCLACDSNCATCVTSATNCLSCNGGKLLEVNKCVTQCSDKYYPDSPNCKNCHSTCATCTGPAATDCKTCIKAHILWKGICQNCADKNNKYFTVIDDICWDKCGTGTRFDTTNLPGLGGYNSCDDGNLVNGDGCSSDCRIEKNFRCEGGTPETPDKCYSKIKPVAVLKKVYRDKYQISFTETVSFRGEDGIDQSTIDLDKFLSISIKGFTNPEDYQYKYDLKQDGVRVKFINITFTFEKTIPENTELEVSFERMSILDINNNTLKNQKVKGDVGFYIPDRFFGEKATNMTSQVNRILGMVTPIASLRNKFSFKNYLALTNYVVQSCVRGLTTIEMLGFSNLLNVKKSSEMDLVLEGIGKNSRKKILSSPSLWMSSKFTGKPINDEGTVNPAPADVESRRRRTLQDTTTTTTATSSTTTTSGITEDQTSSPTEETPETKTVVIPIHETSNFGALIFTKSSSDQFRNAGYVDAMIPNLSFSIVTIFLGAFWYFTSSVFCSGKITIRSNCLMRFLVYGGERCLWISLLFSTLELTIFSVNNILHPDFGHIGNLASFVAACLVLLFVIALPLIIYKITKKRYEILWSPDYYNRYAFFFCEFKLDSKIKKVFMSIYMARIVLFGIAVAALQKKPFLQTVAVALLNLAFFYILVKNKPFVSKVIQILTTIAELFLTLSSICYVISALDDSNPRFGDSGRKWIDFINMISILVCTIFSILAMLYMIFMKLFQEIKKLFYGKKIKGMLPEKPPHHENEVKGLIEAHHENIQERNEVFGDNEGDDDFDVDALEKEFDAEKVKKDGDDDDFDDLEAEFERGDEQKRRVVDEKEMVF